MCRHNECVMSKGIELPKTCETVLKSYKTKTFEPSKTKNELAYYIGMNQVAYYIGVHGLAY